MTIYTSLLTRGFCFKPFIVIPKSQKDNNSYLAHENTHYKRQGFFPFLWVFKYFTDKEFRWEEEKEAFTAEILSKKKDNKYVDYDRYKHILLNQYCNMCSEKEAYEFIAELSFKDPS